MARLPRIDKDIPRGSYKVKWIKQGMEAGAMIGFAEGFKKGVAVGISMVERALGLKRGGWR